MNVNPTPPWSSTAGCTPWFAERLTPLSTGRSGMRPRVANVVSRRSPSLFASTSSLKDTWPGTVVAEAVRLDVELHVGDVQPPEVRARREVVHRELFLVVEHRRVHGAVVAHVADRRRGVPEPGPVVAAVTGFRDLDQRLGVGPHEAQLGDVEHVVPDAVRHGRVSAGAEVAGLGDPRNQALALPGIPTVMRRADPHPAVHV